MLSLADMPELSRLSYVGKTVRYRLSKDPTPRMVEVRLLAIDVRITKRRHKTRIYERRTVWAAVSPVGSSDLWTPVNAQRLFPYDVPNCLKHRSPTYNGGLSRLVRYEGHQ